ncbi:MAG: Crp/Fnr family transcriptional regulator [Burkholderiaceae bacterium]
MSSRNGNGNGNACPPACADCRLRATGAFTPVTPEQLAFIQSMRSDTVRVEAGRTLLPEYRSGDKLYTLYDGWAFRYKTLSDGRRQILNFLLPGDFIGLQEEFADGHGHGVDAVTDISLCVFPTEKLWDLFRTHPKLGYDVTWLAAREEDMIDESLLTAGRRSAIERVAMLLIHLYRRAERVGLAVDGAIKFPFTQEHIADALGLSLVHTNKTLRRLHHLGLHQIREGQLRLLNAQALESIGDYSLRPLRQVPLI